MTHLVESGLSEYSETTETSDSDFPETLHNDGLNVNEAVIKLEDIRTALSQRGSRNREIYVPMPENFNGRVKNLTEEWLQQFVYFAMGSGLKFAKSRNALALKLVYILLVKCEMGSSLGFWYEVIFHACFNEVCDVRLR